MHHSVSEYNTNKQDISDLHECETPKLVFVNICEQPELIILKAKKSSTKIENCEKTKSNIDSQCGIQHKT